MVLIRRIDTEATALQRQGELGIWAQLLGQEAAQIGSGRALRTQDFVFPTYREHGVAWCRGVDPLRLLGLFRGVDQGGWDPNERQLRPLHDRHRRPDAARDRLRDGRPARRRRRHRRPRPRRRRRRLLRRRRDQPGRRQRGVHLRRRPTTRRSSSSARTTSGRSPSRSSGRSRIPLYQRALGFGFPGVRVDGNDVLASYAVTQAALQRARDGQGPTLVEAYTYRMGAHTTSDDPTRYRLAAEVEHWKLKDPIERVKVYLTRNGLADQDFFDERRRRGRRSSARTCARAAGDAGAAHPRRSSTTSTPSRPTSSSQQRDGFAAYLDTFEVPTGDGRRTDGRRSPWPRPSTPACAGDGGRPQGPRHGRGRRQARRRLPDHRRAAEGLRRGPGHRHPARRVRHHRHRGRPGDARLPAGVRDPVRRLRLPGLRPDRQPGRQDPLPQPRAR